MNNDTQFNNWFTDEERQLMKHLLKLLRQSEAEGTDNEQSFLAMEEAGDAFDSIHGDGSVRSIFGRVQQCIELKRERSAMLYRLASRVLGGQSGELAVWLNDSDAAFLKQIGVTL
jgi:hypothetical protein